MFGCVSGLGQSSKKAVRSRPNKPTALFTTTCSLSWRSGQAFMDLSKLEKVFICQNCQFYLLHFAFQGSDLVYPDMWGRLTDKLVATVSLSWNYSHSSSLSLRCSPPCVANRAGIKLSLVNPGTSLRRYNSVSFYDLGGNTELGRASSSVLAKF